MYVRVTNTGQLLDLQRRLRAAGNENLRRSMQRRVRRAAEPLRDDLKSTVRALPIRGKGGSRSGPSPTTRPLRAAIAESIRISVRTTGGGAGARIWIDRSALPSDFPNAAEVTNAPHWRHPVFGNRHAWATSYSKPWWAPTVQKHGPRMLAEVRRCLNDVKNALS